jgi:hypothetical protein
MLGKNHVYIARRIRLLKRPDLMEEYRSGRLMLLQAAALADTNDDGGEDNNEEPGADNGVETVSPRNTLPELDEHGAEDEGNNSEYQLLEREDLPGFVVKRNVEGADANGTGGSGAAGRRLGHNRTGGAGSKRPMFRWRPLIQFHNWVDRTSIADVPPDERATVHRQITEIKEALEKQLAQLEQLDEGTNRIEKVEDEGNTVNTVALADAHTSS